MNQSAQQKVRRSLEAASGAISNLDITTNDTTELGELRKRAEFVLEHLNAWKGRGRKVAKPAQPIPEPGAEVCGHGVVVGVGCSDCEAIGNDND